MRLAPQERQRAGAIADLSLARHAHGFFDGYEAHLHEFGGLARGLTQLDTGSQVDISSLARDAVGGIELANEVEIGRCTAGLFSELAACDFFSVEAWGLKGLTRYMVFFVCAGINRRGAVNESVIR